MLGIVNYLLEDEVLRERSYEEFLTDEMLEDCDIWRKLFHNFPSLRKSKEPLNKEKKLNYDSKIISYNTKIEVDLEMESIEKTDKFKEWIPNKEELKNKLYARLDTSYIGDMPR
jgi:hypothetical protein